MNAAACCGGGSASALIMTSDDKAQVSTSFSVMEVVVDNVDSEGIWRKWSDHQQVKTFRIEAVQIVSDLWQVGAAVPIVQRSQLDKTYSGLGDVVGSLAYEYLPDWNYSRYRPKGIGFLQLTLPTGKAKADSDVGGLDSRGNGFWALGIGTILTKIIFEWDFVTSIEVHKSYDKTVKNSNLQGTLQPGFGGNFRLGAGYNFKDYRIGSQLTWTYEDPIKVDAISTSNGTVERYATATLSGSYIYDEGWSGTVSYSDQTLLGNPINTSLGRSFALQIQKRWGR
ncbi:MAG: hypothetical protein H7235_03855 [Bdellovibrionaceae bacterium]|nr:hypothetical protein [Pseudobdellovibrionaceae bacterium]